MEKVFILFVCDQWLSNESKRILSVCTGFDIAFDFAVMDAEKNNNPLTEAEKKINSLKPNKRTRRQLFN